jgi:hypothetical protein
MGVRATLVGLALLATACGNVVTASQARAVSVRFQGGPPNATVTIDDQLVGPLDVVAARGVALTPGKHRVSVEANGFLPWDGVIDAEAKDAPVRLSVSLVPIPD